MNLFSKIGMVLDAFRAPEPQDVRQTGAVEARVIGGEAVEGRTLPAHVAAWLSGYGETGGKLSDPYNLSPWVSSAIKHITGPIASVDLQFSVTGPAGVVELDDAALTAFWQRPAKGVAKNSRLSRYDVIEATAGWMCLSGEFFWILDDTWLPARSAIRNPLLIARPDKMRPIMEGGELIGWQFVDGGGRSFPLIPDQVISSRFWNPCDDLRGSAPMDSAKMAAEADYASARFWKSLAESNGDLGETIIAPNGITPEQEEQLKMVLRRKRAAAKAGRYEPLFVVGDVKTQAPNIQSPDASAVTQRLQNRHEVYIAFGVPPSFAEVTASYSIGSASDRYKLIEETCMPLAAKIAEAVETVSTRFLGRTVSARFNFDDHSTMQQVRGERIEAGRKMHERGMPWNMVSDYLNLGLKPFPGWDKAWLPFNLQEVKAADLAAKPTTITEPAADPGVKVFEDLEELLRGCPAHPVKSAGPVRRAYMDKAWERQMNVRAPYVKRIRVIVEAACFQARKETLAKLSAAASADKAIRAGAFDFIFDLVDFITGITEPVMEVIVSAYTDAGVDLVENELPAPDAPEDDAPEDSPLIIPADPAGLNRLQARKNFIKDASEEIWTDIRDTLDEGIQVGESYEKLAERVRTAFNGISKEKAMRIAVTETSIAFESGRHDAMIAAGVQWKQWITSDDDRVRDTHVKLHLKRVAIDKPFIVGGAEMMHPCDPNGPAKEIIRCRCIHGPSQPPAEPTMDDIEGNNPDLEIPF